MTIAFVLTAFVSAVRAQVPSPFSASGSGTTTFSFAACAGLPCNDITCGCEDTTGTIKGTKLGTGTFELLGTEDTNDEFKDGTNFCAPISGHVTLTSNNPSTALILEFVGSDCRSSSNTISIITGGYAVEQGTGKLAKVIGTGTLACQKILNTNQTLIQLSGNMATSQ